MCLRADCAQDAQRVEALVAQRGREPHRCGTKPDDTGQVGARVMNGATLSYDTGARLQRQALDPCFALKHWYYEAGASFLSYVVGKVGPAVKAAAGQVNSRSGEPFGNTGPQAGECHT